MKTTNRYCLIIFMSITLFTYNINAQTWEEIGFNLPEGDTASYNTLITFTNKDTGWVFTFTNKGKSYKLFKTTNGGGNWKMMKTLKRNFSPYFFTAIFSMEPDFFYMMNSDQNLTVGNFGRFTTDGGVTWDSTEISNEGFNVLHFFNEEKGIAMGNSHSWITTDGGQTWMQNGKIAFPKDIFFQNENLGWAVGLGPTANDVGYIAKTTDGGETWDYLDIPIPAFTIIDFGIEFTDSLNGFAIGDDLTKTSDGGKNWNDDYSVLGYDIGFLNNKYGWVSSYKRIYRTSDGGETWELQFGPVENFLFKKIIILKKAKVAYVLGVNPDSNTATLLRADLSSITDVKDENATLPLKPFLEQNYPNPFNPTTSIDYQVSRLEMVTLKIYDILGNEITTLVNETKLPGTYKVNFNSNQLASGVYIARLTAGRFHKSIKLSLVK